MDGFGNNVNFDGDSLEIRATNKVASFALGTSHASIAVDDIDSVSIEAASLLTNGHLDVVCRDGRKYILHFRRKQEPPFQELYRSLTAAVATREKIQPLDMLGRGRGYYDQSVAGESHYFRDLAHLAGPDLTGELELTASLQREPKNRYDPKAVKVIIAGRHIGYLPREDASEYTAALQFMEQEGRLATCKARLWWSRQRDDFIASVSLDLADPAHVAPVVLPDTTRRRVILPGRRSYKIQGESEHMDVLTPLMNRAYIAGKVAAYGTVHIVEQKMARSTRKVIVVRIEDNKIGELTKQISTKFLPLVEPLENTGIACYAVVLLSGNALAVEADIRLTPPEDLPQDFVQYVQSELSR
jgi:hypothetical protein